MCSLCRNGIVGGGLYLDRESVTYRCQKYTVDARYKKLVLPLKDIKQLSWKWIVFPAAVFQMESGEKYTFLIFNKWRFEKWFRTFHSP